jgi:2-polyprenyl-6-methoxyphenol hydroxylase-like FAD-dependent oxidoreductase
VVGADGRRSSVRSQAGIELDVDPPAHLIAGMLVDTVEGVDVRVNVIAREADVIFYSFPQERGQARLYFSFPNGQATRFSGRDGPQRFLDTCKLPCIEGVASWHAARPAGPCGTFPGEDSQACDLVRDGVILVGDAGGYENPLQGQGLSMALQDVYDVAEALLASDPTEAGLAQYVGRRRTRKRLADLGTLLEVWMNEGCVVQDPEERAARSAFIEGDELLAALEMCFMTGFDTLPQDMTRADLDDRLAAYA